MVICIKNNSFVDRYTYLKENTYFFITPQDVKLFLCLTKGLKQRLKSFLKISMLGQWGSSLCILNEWVHKLLPTTANEKTETEKLPTCHVK